MRDLFFLIVILMVTAGISFDTARRLRWRSQPWPVRRILLLAPLPIPAVLFGFSAWLLIDAFNANPEECRVDACGMAAAGAMFMMASALVIYITGLCAASWAVRGLKE